MLDPHYILGLVDGEGSFTVYVQNVERNNRKRRVRAEPRFYLKLIEKDKDILYELKKFFGCGNVYFQKDNRPNHQNCYRYEVANRRDLVKKIIPFFRVNHLKLASRNNDFECFSRLVSMMERGDHLTPRGLKKMYAIKQQMH